MTSFILLSLLASIASAQLSPNALLYSPAQLQPPSFLAPDAQILDTNAYHALLRRQSACAASYTSCTSNLCCQPNTHCTTDFAGNAACCPNNAVCTGTISGAASASATPSPSSSPSSTSQAQATTSSTSPTSTPSSTPTDTGAATVTVTVGYAAPSPAPTAGGGAVLGGTVPGAPFPWSYIPRTFSNQGECSSYASGCQKTYSSCTASLGAGGAGQAVTVVGAGVTTSNGGGSQGGSSSAASVCSSLSVVACGGLQESLCTQYSSGGGGGGGTPNAGARRTSGLEDVLNAGLGMVVGMLGGLAL